MMNFFDRFIAVFNPKVAFRRMQFRLGIETLKERGYDAASNGRRTQNWRATNASANTEIAFTGIALRNRSRELARNNPYARKALRVIPSNVIGVGIQPSIKVSGSENAESRLKLAWKSWAKKTSCDFSGNKTFYAIQKLVFRSMLESGEVFIVEKTSKGANKLGFQLQVLEADYLDYSKDGIRTEGGGYIRQGIEFDSKGKRIAYWMFEQHPGESSVNFKTTSVKIEAKRVIHLYEEERPGQDRGVPIGVSSMVRLRDFNEYADAQLIRQKIAACFSTFITSDAHSVRPSKSGTDGGFDLERVEPGMIERLRPGEQVSFGNPPPAEGYSEYSRSILQGIAAGYDTTYEAITGDLSNVNFSSGRMGWIEFGRFVQEWQELLLIPVLCDRVFEWFLKYAIISKVIPSEAEESVSVTWTAPRREFVDPLKEIKALVEQVRAGFVSWQEAVRMLGYDPEEIIEQLKSDAAKFDEAGLMPTSDPRFDTNRVSDDEEDLDESNNENNSSRKEENGLVLN